MFVEGTTNLNETVTECDHPLETQYDEFGELLGELQQNYRKRCTFKT
jgi:hypothetical protein